MTNIDPLVAEYRRQRGWDPDPGKTSRISVELTRDLVRRLNRQARLMDVPRQFLIESALLALVHDFEKIDDDHACLNCNKPMSEHGLMAECYSDRADSDGIAPTDSRRLRPKNADEMETS